MRRLPTNARGDYRTRLTLAPAEAANAWAFPSTKVGAPLVVRLSIEFGGGFEGIADPGEFVLTRVVTDFERSPLIPVEATTTMDRHLPGIPARPAPPPPVVAPVKPAVLFANEFAGKGRAIADANGLVAALREAEPEGPVRTGFDIGMGAWLGHTANSADGPGQGADRCRTAGLRRCGGVFRSVEQQHGVRRQGAAIADLDPDVAAARAKVRGATPDGLRAALYWLGFDIATGIFGDPKLGAQGNTLIGPGSEKIRATLGADGQQGFNDSLAFNVVRR